MSTYRWQDNDTPLLHIFKRHKGSWNEPNSRVSLCGEAALTSMGELLIVGKKPDGCCEECHLKYKGRVDR